MSGNGIIYWDSCIFIAHLKNEVRQDPQDMLGINELVDSFDLGQIDLVTSTITFTEVLRTTITPQDYERFKSFFFRRNCHLMDVTRRIAEISHEIRNFYYQPGGPVLGTPDCIHLATAISFQCDVLYTFDGCGKSTKPGLLSLHSPIANRYDLSIQKPIPTRPPQLSLNL